MAELHKVEKKRDKVSNEIMPGVFRYTLKHPREDIDGNIVQLAEYHSVTIKDLDDQIENFTTRIASLTGQMNRLVEIKRQIEAL